LLLLDVSPSMQLTDAGQTNKQSRMHRTADVVQSLFDRLGVAKYRTTVVAFYTEGKPVVERTSDIEVVSNIIRDLPMHHAFISGKTDIFSGLKKAAEVAHPWRPKSTLLVVLSDGDTIPPTGMPKMPASVGGVLVVGIGDQRSGSFIDGRQSRQDASMLRQLAVRMGGQYHNGNVKHIPTETIRELGARGSKPKWEEWTSREYALLACILSGCVLAMLPLMLHYLGTSWRPGVAVGKRFGEKKISVSQV
jgi:Ca-activated chloride channel family protein